MFVNRGKKTFSLVRKINLGVKLRFFYYVFLICAIFQKNYCYPLVCDAIVNLGGDCQTAYQLSINGLRQYALPFDSLITPYDSLKSMIENNFDGFLNLENFRLSINENQEKFILDLKYKTRIFHDFRLDRFFFKDYKSFRDKYQRRISRFLTLLDNSVCPIFFRLQINKLQTIELRNLLEIRRNKKPFLLVVLSSDENFKEDWELEGVRNFYLTSDKNSWMGDNDAYKQIFQFLKLI